MTAGPDDGSPPLPVDHLDHQGEHYYRSLFRSDPLPRVLIDRRSGWVLDANPAALAWMGCTLQAIRMHQIQSLILRDAESVLDDLAVIEETGGGLDTSVLTAADGQAAVRLYCHGIRIGRLACLNVALIDTTEARRDAAALASFRTMADAMPLGLYRTTPGSVGYFLYVNPAMLRIFGARNEEDLLATRVADLYRNPAERALFIRHLEQEGAVQGLEMALQTLSGQPVDARVTAYTGLDAEGERFIEGSLEDITEHRASERALEWERGLFYGGRTVVVQVSASERGTIGYVSPNVEQVFGYAPAEWTGNAFWDYVHPEDRSRLRSRSLHLAAGRVEGVEAEYRLIDARGQSRYVADFALPHHDAAGEVIQRHHYIVDITERRIEEEERRLLATAFETSQALMITDRQGTIERVNPAFTETTGYTPEEVEGRTPAVLSSGMHDRSFYETFWNSLLEKGRWEGEIWNRRKDGEVFPEWQSVKAVYNAQGEIERFVSVFHDISEQKRLEQELERLAIEDHLTGLYARRQVERMLHDECARSERYGTTVAVVMLDVDHFKAINDTLGHHVGDEVLRQLAVRLRGQTRRSDILGRWGGEEFLLLLPETGPDEAAAVAEKIRRSVSEVAFETVGGITISLGVAARRAGEGPGELVHRADEALYESKRNGRNAVTVF